MSEIEDRIRKIGVIPVVSIPKEEHAMPLAEALIAGGLPCAEITFRTDAAAGSIKAMRKRFPEMLIGAGTILTIDQAGSAIDAGADFLVSPGSNPAVINYCLENKISIIPGVCTPTEIEVTMSRGLSLLKFFPAEAMGGVKFLKAICAPYRMIKFIPTGGIDLTNLADYLTISQVVACGGSWMVKPELMTAGQFDRIESLAIEAAHAIRNARLTNSTLWK